MAKRRKGKQSSGRSTPNSLPPSAPTSDNEEDSSSKQEEKEEVAAKKTNADFSTETNGEPPLVLTSEKRRGVYECDYCHSDISQLPRIRCAVCPDFDLCLDCFATTDHSAAIARLKAAATTHSELSKDGIESTMVAGMSAANHDHTHGYRVCDSTRYPILGSTRNIVFETSETGSENDSQNNADAATDTSSDIMVVTDDPKAIWTAEEDLRLLDGIKTHGLGNWSDISEAVGGNGSLGKSSKRCMERFFDDFLGRYGHILPPYTILDETVEEDIVTANDADSSKGDDDEVVRSSKRRVSALSRMPSNLSTTSTPGRGSRKKFKVVRTETLPGYDELWPNPYLPAVEGVKIGQEVAREQSKKAELAFVRATADAASKEEADKIRKEWMETKMKQPGAPTVLPPRPEDTALLPGANLMGFMPRRGDFDTEWENDAEQAIADMEFTQADSEQDRQLKLQVLDIYYQKQEEREKRKKFIMTRSLYDYRKFLEDEEKIPADERDLVHRLRLFERFHTPDEHKQFIADILKAKRLRKEIATLQMYRRIGIRSLLEAEKYELDKERRQFHKIAQLQKEAEAKAKVAATPGAVVGTTSIATSPTNEHKATDFLWKQYRTSDRKARRSLNRTGETEMETPEKNDPPETKDASDKEKGVEEDVEMKDAGGKKEEQKTDVDDEMKDNTEKQTAAETEKDEESQFDISGSKGFDLLSRKEVALCARLHVFPLQYLEIKKALIHESLKKGLLDKEGSGSSKRIIVKVDVEKRGNILDFLVRAGWISQSLAKVARTVTPPGVD
eukprot:scaffold1242_cov123-Cylindrotheca_fusiformis.AAC.5